MVRKLSAATQSVLLTCGSGEFERGVCVAMELGPRTAGAVMDVIQGHQQGHHNCHHEEVAGGV